MHQRDQRYRRRAGAERDDVAHCERPGAPVFIGVGRHHRVIDRYLSEDEEHHRERHGQHRVVFRRPGEDQQRRLQRHDRHKHRLDRKAVEKIPDDELRHRGYRIDDRNKHADTERGVDQRRQPFVEYLGHGNRRRVEDNAAAQGGNQQDSEHAQQHRPGMKRRAGGTLWPGLLAGVGHEQHEANPQRDRNQSWNDERRAPVYPVCERPRNDRRKCQPEVAVDTVHPEYATDLGAPTDQHRDTDRVIDGAEHTDQREPRCNLPGGLRQSRQHGGCADADEKQRHHAAPAPAVRQPPCRQRAGAEHDERAEGQRQHFAVAPAEFRRHGDHHRRKDQHEQMIERVAEVEKQLRGAGLLQLIPRERFNGVP